MGSRDKIDLLFTSEGDYVVGETGDLADTYEHPYRARVQQMYTRLASSRGDWKHQVDIGASLSEFEGAPNTKETGDLIKARVISELIREGLVSSRDLKVDVIPLGPRNIAVLVLHVPPGSSKAIYLNFTYDLAQNKLVPRNL